MLDLSKHPLVMGIVNVTPDSFSDGGRFFAPGCAIEHAARLAEEGADILDIGGESTRPGARPVSLQEELDRVMPVLEGVSGFGVPISVDTMKPEVMRAALGAGAAMINDVNAFRSPGAWAAVQGSGCMLCVMHMPGDPRTMHEVPEYRDVAAEVESFLAERIAAAVAEGIEPARIVVDPGFGFGKSLDHNLALLRELGRFGKLAPVLAGVSRKRMIGALTGRDMEGRMAGSLAAALRAVENGAAIVRVHDVKETVDALKVWRATA